MSCSFRRSESDSISLYLNRHCSLRAHQFKSCRQVRELRRSKCRARLIPQGIRNLFRLSCPQISLFFTVEQTQNALTLALILLCCICNLPKYTIKLQHNNDEAAVREQTLPFTMIPYAMNSAPSAFRNLVRTFRLLQSRVGAQQKITAARQTQTVDRDGQDPSRQFPPLVRLASYPRYSCVAGTDRHRRPRLVYPCFFLQWPPHVYSCQMVHPLHPLQEWLDRTS